VSDDDAVRDPEPEAGDAHDSLGVTDDGEDRFDGA
jgi:hypothetical protein